MSALVIPPFGAETLPALPAADIDRAAAFARQDKAAATRAAYRSDFARFRAVLPQPRRRLAPGHA
jgi:hypothetical protein